VPEAVDPGPAPLRLVPPHDHVWALSAILHEDGATYQELACGCGAVTFR
jgi:hypothetical protein